MSFLFHRNLLDTQEKEEFWNLVVGQGKCHIPSANTRLSLTLWNLKATQDTWVEASLTAWEEAEMEPANEFGKGGRTTKFGGKS